jgi:arsenite-transporting ATPase
VRHIALAGLQKQRAIYESSVAALADDARTTLVLVSRPQKAALDEAERTSGELCPEDKAATALELRGTTARHTKGDFLKRLPTVEVPLRAHNLVGIPALRKLVRNGEAERFEVNDPGQDLPPLESLTQLVDELVRSGRGAIMTMGKGGVGKTTVAAAIATELARRGLPVHLSTTDPAAHVAAAAGETAGFEVSRINPQAETTAYVEQVLATAGLGLDANGRALLEEDLRSPCTEEIAVFRAFARILAQGQDRFVVLDTAPTGHTLLLLDATEAYHREIARKASDLPEEVLQLLPRLRDARFTRVLIVTLPEATPVHEAAALQTDLRRAQIEPFAWVINQSFARADTRDPLLLARGAGERPFIHEVTRDLARRTAIVPWVPEEPVGPEKLRQLFQTTTVS